MVTTLNAVLFSRPEDVAMLCRSHGIVAPGGMVALESLFSRITGRPCSVNYMFITVGDESYGMTQSLREFVRRFNAGEYPEIDSPEHRQAAMTMETRDERMAALLYFSVLLGKTSEQVAERLRRAGCFGATPLDALKMWFDMCVCEPTAVSEDRVSWRDAEVQLPPAAREFIRRWDDFPLVHFVIPRQLDEGAEGKREEA